LLAQSLLNRSAGGYISRELDKLREKLFLAVQPADLSAETAGKLFSAVWSGFSPVQEEIFRMVTHALLKNRLIRFTYRSPASSEITTRIGEPHHLQFYMASWVLIAYCRERKNFRKFYLSRMTDLRLLEAVFEPRSEDDWRPLLENAFGIFQGLKCTSVILRFSPFRARWVREQQWHPDQALAERPDGGIDLTLPVADFREIKMKVLQFGADCEVVSPEALRIEVQSEIDRMAGVYQKK
jgi:predicted DNA-binding transcriptional regulator YafY